MKKKILFTILGVTLVYGAVAFAIKAGIGVMPIDAFIASAAAVLNMKVGTFSIALSLVLFGSQILMEGKNFRKTECFQLLYLFLGGSVLNFFLYTILGNVTFTAYPIRLLVTLAAFLVSAFGVTLVLETHLMRTPIEGFVLLLSQRLGIANGKLRQRFDITLVILCVALTLIFGTEWTLREGTVIAALIFGPAMDFWKKTVFTKK